MRCSGEEENEMRCGDLSEQDEARREEMRCEEVRWDGVGLR